MAVLALEYLGYFAVLMALVFWVRSYTWTEEEIKTILNEKEDILLLLLNYKINKYVPIDDNKLFLNDGS